MIGRRLNEAEIASYDVVPDHIARRVLVVSIPFIPGGYAGMTLGTMVLLAKEVKADGSSSLMAHELVHARQWREAGMVGFAWQYLLSFAKNLYRYRRWQQAYHNVDAELQAQYETADWLRRRARDARSEADRNEADGHGET